MFFKPQSPFRATLRVGPTAGSYAARGTGSIFQGSALRGFAATPAGYAVGRRLAFHTSLLEAVTDDSETAWLHEHIAS